MKKDKNSTFSTTYPDVVLCCQSQYHKHGPEKFFTLFGKEWNDCGGYEPLFLASNYSCSGEMANTYGLFKKNNSIYEVHGTECSMWDFDGQWQLEKVTWEVVLHKINKGELGHGYSYDEQEFATELKALVIEKMEEAELLNYDKATEEEKFNLYTKQFHSQDFLINNIIIDSLLKDFTYTNQYASILKPDYEQSFKDVFINNICIANDVENYYAYSFKAENTMVFLTVSNNNQYEMFIGHKDIHKNDFSLFSISKDINGIGENIALSLLERTNLFISNKESIAKVKFN